MTYQLGDTVTVNFSNTSSTNVEIIEIHYVDNEVSHYTVAERMPNGNLDWLQGEIYPDNTNHQLAS